MMPSSMEVTTYGGHRLDTGRDESVEFMWSESKLGASQAAGPGQSTNYYYGDSIESGAVESSVVVTTPGMFRHNGLDGDPINASIMTHSTLHTGAKIISTTRIWLFPACCELCGLIDCIPALVFYRRLQIPKLVNILINSTRGKPSLHVPYSHEGPCTNITSYPKSWNFDDKH